VLEPCIWNEIGLEEIKIYLKLPEPVSFVY